MSDQRAIIDIGSNTVRLVVYNGPARAPAVLLNEKVTAKLGRDVVKTGLLSEKAMGLALSALARFAVLLRQMGVSDVDVVATAAARDAQNGPEFLDEVAKLGFAPRLLSGEEEARTSALGVIAAFPGACGVAGDLGGGSLELTAIGSGECGRGITLPFGTLRLPDLRAEGEATLSSQVRKALRSAKWEDGRGETFFLVGGSWRALSRYAMYQLGWPLDDPHGFEIAPDEAIKLCRKAAQGKFDANMPRISSSRLATLPDAAALLGQLVRVIEPSRLVFSSWGLREGLLYSKLDKATRAQDPMLAGVTAFSEGLGVSPSTATMVAGWTAGANPTGFSGDGKLRLAATMLALAAMQSEPNLRAEQAMSWALRKRWIGLDARGRARMAMTVLANSGRIAIPEEFAPLASEEELKQAIGWGLAIRLCRKLTGSAPHAISGTSLVRDDERLLLVVREPFHALFTDSVGKDLRWLAEWLEVDPSVEFSRESVRV
ncbi:MAG: Ppx/GppA family phosphatase [Novosphingobium sp.]|nr:Ppx/GppA family phosphatase [Novosphingobium sp.]